ncbi:hypothetical protein [Scytonema sp. NUACC26]|uniref:hypothetical protein n=1 Tax=Scytonema sp. NUACC26 TaxID=3140176 RepID=UPI0034DB99CF
MVGLTHSQDSKVNIMVPVQRLVRAIQVSQGEFSLLLVCCHSTVKQTHILHLLKEFCPTEIKEIALPPAAETFYTTVSDLLGSARPQALIVKGLESVTAINQLIVSTNLMRDELRKRFQYPLVLWVNDEILQKLVWLAPDLKNWAACTIRFDLANEQ